MVAVRDRDDVFVVGADVHGEPGDEGDDRGGGGFPRAMGGVQWHNRRGRDEHGVAAGRDRIGTEHADPDRTADGGGVLPGHAGAVQCVFAAWPSRQGSGDGAALYAAGAGP